MLLSVNVVDWMVRLQSVILPDWGSEDHHR
jgi:hypothetical protein